MPGKCFRTLPDKTREMGKPLVDAVRALLRKGLSEPFMTSNLRIGTFDLFSGGLKADLVGGLRIDVRAALKVGGADVPSQGRFMTAIEACALGAGKRIFPLVLEDGELDDGKRFLLMEDLRGYRRLFDYVYAIRKPRRTDWMRAAVIKTMEALRAIRNAGGSGALEGLRCRAEPFVPRLRHRLKAALTVDPDLEPVMRLAGTVLGLPCPPLEELLEEAEAWLAEGAADRRLELQHGDPHLKNIMLRSYPKGFALRLIDPNPDIGFTDPLYDVGKLLHWVEPVGWTQTDRNLCDSTWTPPRGRGLWALDATVRRAPEHVERCRASLETLILERTARRLDPVDPRWRERLPLAIAAAHVGLAAIDGDDQEKSRMVRRFALAHALGHLARWHAARRERRPSERNRLQEPARLSKSRILAGLQCPKRLYLQVHCPQVGAESGTHVEDGRLVGEAACATFPGGVRMHAPSSNPGREVARTLELMRDPGVQTIFEAAFEHQGVLVRADILARSRDGEWDLIEVKSTKAIKDAHIDDLAIQLAVLEGAGVQVHGVSLMHVNGGHVLDGPLPWTRDAFKTIDVARKARERARRLDWAEIGEMVRMLGQPDPPDIAMGSQCRKPIDCEFMAVCSGKAGLTDDDVRLLPGRPEKVRELVERGITSMRDVPADARLDKLQARIIRSVRRGTDAVEGRLRSALDRLQYPICYMDFETWAPPLPQFPGTTAYEKIPFQWSLHIETSPHDEPRHEAFLADGPNDPRPAFAETLFRHLESHGGMVVVYNKPTEEGVLKALGRWSPDLAPLAGRVIGRLWDLYDELKRGYYHPKFRGSFSIKRVLPALAAGSGYSGLEVAVGTAASAAYAELRVTSAPARREQLRKNLLEYCKQDTLAMVQIVRELRKKPVA